MAIDSVTLEGFLPELGIFTLLSFLLTLMYFETVKGKIHRIPGQIASYPWVTIQSEIKRKKLAKCMTGFVITFLLIPIITLIIWGSIVSYSTDDTRSDLDTNPKPLITPIAIFLVGFAAMAFLIGVLNTKWKKYRLTKCSLFLTAAGLLLLVVFQIVAVFLDEPISYFGVSTIFLAANALFVILVVFINSDTGGRSAQDIIEKLPVSDEAEKPIDNELEEVKELEIEQHPSGQSQHSHHSDEAFSKKRASTKKHHQLLSRMKESFHGPAVVDQPVRDRYRDIPFDEELAHDEEDPDYTVTKQEVAELFTLADVQLKGGMAGAFGGGIQKLFAKMTKQRLCCYSFILYSIAIGILVGYAFTVNEYTAEGRLGWLNGISLIIIDILIGLYFHSGIVNAPAQIALMVVTFRALTFVFGGKHWYLGYSLLFMIFGVVIALAIARKHYPFSQDFEEAFKARRIGGRKKVGLERVDLSRSPEFLYLLQILLFAGLTIIVEWVQPKGVPRPRFEIVSGADFAYYWFGIMSVLLSALFLSIFFMARILYRQKIKLYPTKNFFLFWSWFTPYWIYALVFYAFALIGGYILWILLDQDWTVFTLCAFIPPLILLALNAYTNYVGNDYQILQDVREENRLREREYKRRKNALRKARSIKEDMMRGTMTKFGESKSTQPQDPLAMTMSKFKDSLDMPGGLEAEPKSPEMNKEHSLEQSGGPPSPENKESDMKRVMEMAQDKDLQLILEAQEYTEIFDWRLVAKNNCCKAFCKGQLRPNDYNIIISLILFFFINIVMGLTLSSIRDNWSGMSLTVALFGYYFSFAPLIRVIATDAKMRCPENTSFIFAYIIVYVYGILFFLFHLDSEPKNERDFIIGYMVVLPFTFSLICGVYKWYDNRWKFGPFVIGMFVLCFVYVFVAVALAWWLYSFISGLVILIVALLLIYAVFVLAYYIRNKYYMPRGLFYTNLAIALLIVLLALVLSIALDGFNIFVGFSISFGVLVLIVFVLGLDDLGGDLMHIEDEPLFFSPWVFPIYQFNSKKDRLVQRNRGALLVYLALMLALAWSILCIVWIDPMYIGVGVCALTEMLLVIITLYLSSFSPLQLKASWPFIDNKTLKRAWLQAKKEYTTGRNAFSMADLQTFADVNRLAYDCQGHIRGLMRKPPIRVWEKLPENAPQNVNIDSIHSLMGYLFQLQEDANEVYIEEMELIVHFQMLLIVYSKSVQISERQKLFKFLGSKSTILLANGVDVKWKMKTNDSVRFARIMNQVERLPAQKRVLFQKMMEAYELSEMRKAQLDLERERKEHEAMMKREERRQQRKKQKEITEVPKDVPLDDLPDTLGKWLRILEEHTQDNKFTDGQFPPNDESLGQNVRDRVHEWIRADMSYDLYKGEVNHLDIEQGMLGDCYFLSALSVLGDKRVKSTIVTQPGQRIGGYCVIFYDDTGAQDHVIVDDYIPIDREGRPCFVASREHGELWPVIIEKAYAKLNGSYQNIEAGKVQYALADLTGGVPEEIKLSSVSNKISSFWEKIVKYHEGGYLMGAGTPEHEMGDRAINDLGIVQGHAYSILDVKEVDGNKLMRLMNPHGTRGVEWDGDWGDNSDKWTQRIKNRIHYEDKEDGAFWMGVNDFVEQFKNIYICRQFDKAQWKMMEMQGEWKGESAAGLPSRSNPKCQIQNNPHYGIRVGKPCTLFILVTQSEGIDTFKGKLPIMFLLLKNKGERITKLKRELIVGQSGNPTNLKTITAEITLDKTLSYPYTFSLMVASAFSGEKGESAFTMKIYSTSGFTVKPLPE